MRSIFGLWFPKADFTNQQKDITWMRRTLAAREKGY